MADIDKADGAQALDRALTLLRLIGARSKFGLRLTELVVQSGLTKPTVHRMLRALERNGFVEQNPATRLYHLGPESFVLGVLSAERFGIHRAAAGALTRLAEVCEDTVFLSVRRENHAVCLERREGDFPIKTHVLQAGDRHPLGVGAGSLAILSALDDADIAEVLAQNAAELAEAYPAYSPDMLREQVAQTRAQGFALNPGLLLAGSWAIGVAVLDAGGSCLGALSISAIESRLGEPRRLELAAVLKEEAQRLAQRLARPEPLAAAEPSRPALRMRKQS